MSCKIGDNCSCGFKNTGMKYGDVWDGINKLIDDKVGCEECNIHGHEMINGLRDVVKVGIGGTAYDKKQLAKFVSEVTCAYEHCKSDGRC